MARHILEYYDERYRLIPAEHAIELLETAHIAASGGEIHVRCRVEKDLANGLRQVRRFSDANAALDRFEMLTAETHACGLHRALLAFARAALSTDVHRWSEATDFAEIAIAAFEKHGAHDRAYHVRLYESVTRYKYGDYLSALNGHLDSARRALLAGRQSEAAWAHMNAGICYDCLRDFMSAGNCFAEAARLFRSCGIDAAEACALRGTAEMTIAVQGEAALHLMEAPKTLFLELNLAGEVCRSTLAMMWGLFKKDPTTDLQPLCQQLTEEARTLGVLAAVRGPMRELTHAVLERCVTEKLFDELWYAFGPRSSFAVISGQFTVSS